MEEIEVELRDLKVRRLQQDSKIENIENLALRQRFQDISDRLYQEQVTKESEMYEIIALIKNID